MPIRSTRAPNALGSPLRTWLAFAHIVRPQLLPGFQSDLPRSWRARDFLTRFVTPVLVVCAVHDCIGDP
jgi:hypothetical protein